MSKTWLALCNGVADVLSPVPGLWVHRLKRSRVLSRIPIGRKDRSSAEKVLDPIDPYLVARVSISRFDRLFSRQNICALKSRIIAYPVGIPEAADAPAPRNQATRFGLNASAVANSTAEMVEIELCTVLLFFSYILFLCPSYHEFGALQHRVCRFPGSAKL